MRASGLLWPTVAAVVAMAILIGLGLWQLQRLQWKLALIAQIEQRVHASPVPIETILTAVSADPSADVAYTHVQATGQFDHERERYLYSTGESDWGFDVLTPLQLAGGQSVIVNRGFVPRQQLDRASRSAALVAGQVTVTGLVRKPASRPWTVPAGDAGRETWYWPEIAAIAASMNPTGRKVIDALYIDADPTGGPVPPQGGATNIDLPNRHLEYAMTWFGLAAALALVYGTFAYGRITTGRG